MTLAQLLEQYVSLGIFLLAAALATLSAIAWRRERDRRMAIVTAGYAMFAVYGLVVFLEYLLTPYVPYATLELFEHAVALLILGGLLAFFVALTHEQ
jgi:CHASE2 domain-containing sensor protein